MKELSRNYRKFEKVFFIYFAMMIIINLIFSSDKSLIDRFATVAAPIFVFSMIFSCYGNILKEAIIKPSWKSRMKLANRSLTFFFGLGCVIFLWSLFRIVDEPSSFVGGTYLSAIGASFIYATLRSKYKYIYNFDHAIYNYDFAEERSIPAIDEYILDNGRIRLYEDKFELSKLQIVPLKYFDEKILIIEEEIDYAEIKEIKLKEGNLFLKGRLQLILKQKREKSNLGLKQNECNQISLTISNKKMNTARELKDKLINYARLEYLDETKYLNSDR